MRGLAFLRLRVSRHLRQVLQQPLLRLRGILLTLHKAALVVVGLSVAISGMIMMSRVRQPLFTRNPDDFSGIEGLDLRPVPHEGAGPAGGAGPST